MKRVGIIGLGLMGSSLGLALKRRGLAAVAGWARREETRRLAVELSVVDEVFDTPKAAVQGADIAVFCTPVCSIPDLVRDCAGGFKPGAVVTDVGSTKAELMRIVVPLLKGTGAAFVGSHPMAGSDKTGVEAGRADLYEGAITAVTGDPETPMQAVDDVTWMWSGVGCRVVPLNPLDHDILVARTSHLPHLVAALLARTVGRDAVPLVGDFCGTGFRDATRIAAGSPEMWHDIVKTNRAALLDELWAYDAALLELIGKLEKDDFDGIRDLLAAARETRSSLLKA